MKQKKRCEVQTHIQSVELMKQNFLASCRCALGTRYCLANIHPLHTLTLKYTMSYHTQYYSEDLEIYSYWVA